eukprot:4212131-Pleurochrysis_carterae.AAC.3
MSTGGSHIRVRFSAARRRRRWKAVMRSFLPRYREMPPSATHALLARSTVAKSGVGARAASRHDMRHPKELREAAQRVADVACAVSPSTAFHLPPSTSPPNVPAPVSAGSGVWPPSSFTTCGVPALGPVQARSPLASRSPPPSTG